MEPFVAPFQGQALTQRAKTYVSGLLSDVERKNVESITYQFGQNRLGLQGFIGWADWDDEPLRQELLGQVGKPLGQGDGVLVFDPSAFPKSGRESVKQWAESLGDEAWRRVDVRDGSKGPLVVDVVKRRMVSRTHRRQQGGKELLVVIRYRD